MERLTNHFDYCEFIDCGCLEEGECLAFTDEEKCYKKSVYEKLREYEDLEEKLTKVYGECDGLLETAINSLLKHEGAEIGTPAKARLLTDEDVDQWESFKEAEEQGLLMRLPCKVGDRFWELNTANGIPHIYPRMAHSLSLCVYVLERLGKTDFLTKEEAEAALEKMND